MSIQRPKYSIRGILAATMWMCVCFGSYAIITRFHNQHVSQPWEGLLTWVMMIAPFVAIGAVFNRTLAGVLVGILAVTVFWTIFNLT
jgi:hypothetical protein